MPAYRRMHSAYNMFRMPSQALVHISQRKFTAHVLIAIRTLPGNVAAALLEQAFDMRILMQAQCKTRLHGALVTKRNLNLAYYRRQAAGSKCSAVIPTVFTKRDVIPTFFVKSDAKPG